MFLYFLRRLSYLAPTLIVISLIAFALSKTAPGDPVELLLRRSGDDNFRDLRQAEQSYRQTARILGLDKPVFYFSLLPAAYPDTLYRILNPGHRHTLRQLCARFGEWPLVQNYYHALRNYEQTLVRQRGADWKFHLTSCMRIVQDLYLSTDPTTISHLLRQLQTLHQEKVPDLPERQLMQEAFYQIQPVAKPWKRYLPQMAWHGLDNQYHNWLAGCLQGNFGVSYRDGQPVSGKIRRALRWTLWLNLLSLLIAYGLSVPLGVYMAVNRDSAFDRISQILLFFLYALPAFWIATLLLMVFSNPNLGIQWVSFSQAGEYPPGATRIQQFLTDLKYLALPVFCLTYGSLAFIALQMRSAMAEVLTQDYIRTARAKGLPESAVIWKHALRNALFPLITLLGTVFPSMIAGSVIIESIFNLPGMGKLTIEAIFSQDWPVVYAILLLSALLTITGLLLADLIYAWTDPRVRLNTENRSRT